MIDFIDIIKIVGACSAVIGTSYTILNSKKILLRRIDHKEAQIIKIDSELYRRYGLNRGSFHPITHLDAKKERLQKQIEDLRRLL